MEIPARNSSNRYGLTLIIGVSAAILSAVITLPVGVHFGRRLGIAEKAAFDLATDITLTARFDAQDFEATEQKILMQLQANLLEARYLDDAPPLIKLFASSSLQERYPKLQQDAKELIEKKLATGRGGEIK